MKVITALLSTAVCFCKPEDNLAFRGYTFDNYISQFDKKYKNDAERQKRAGIFEENLKKIIDMNEKSTSATFGVNLFTDMTEEEMRQYSNGIHPDLN